VKLRLRNPTATVAEDELGRKRLVVVATDAWGGVWVNPDALNGTKWQPLTPEAVEPEPQPSA